MSWPSKQHNTQGQKQKQKREDEEALNAAIEQARRAQKTAAPTTPPKPAATAHRLRKRGTGPLDPDAKMRALRTTRYNELRNEMRAWVGIRGAVATAERSAMSAALHALSLTNDVPRRPTATPAALLALAANEFEAACREADPTVDIVRMHTNVLRAAHAHAQCLAEPSHDFWARITASFALRVGDRTDEEVLRFLAVAAKRMALADRIGPDDTVESLVSGGSFSAPWIKELADACATSGALSLAVQLYSAWGKRLGGSGRISLAEAVTAQAMHTGDATHLAGAVFEERKMLWILMATVNECKVSAVLQSTKRPTTLSVRCSRLWLAAARRLYMHDAWRYRMHCTDVEACAATRYLAEAPPPGAEYDDTVALPLPVPDLPLVPQLLSLRSCFTAVHALTAVCISGFDEDGATPVSAVRSDETSLDVTVEAWLHRAVQRLAAVLAHVPGAGKDTGNAVPEKHPNDGFFDGPPADAPPLSSLPETCKARLDYARLSTFFFREVLPARMAAGFCKRKRTESQADDEAHWDSW